MVLSVCEPLDVMPAPGNQVKCADQGETASHELPQDPLIRVIRKFKARRVGVIQSLCSITGSPTFLLWPDYRIPVSKLCVLVPPYPVGEEVISGGTSRLNHALKLPPAYQLVIHDALVGLCKRRREGHFSIDLLRSFYFVSP